MTLLIALSRAEPDGNEVTQAAAACGSVFAHCDTTDDAALSCVLPAGRPDMNFAASSGEFWAIPEATPDTNELRACPSTIAEAISRAAFASRPAMDDPIRFMNWSCCDPSGSDRAKSSAPWGSTCDHCGARLLMAFSRPCPSGNCCAQEIAEVRSACDHWEATWLKKLSRSRLAGRLFANSAAAFGSF